MHPFAMGLGPSGLSRTQSLGVKGLGCIGFRDLSRDMEAEREGLRGILGDAQKDAPEYLYYP